MTAWLRYAGLYASMIASWSYSFHPASVLTSDSHPAASHSRDPVSC